MCGAGAAGIELAFAFKRRWSDLFGQDIELKLVSSQEDIMLHESLQSRNDTKRKLKEKGIEIIRNGRIDKIIKQGIKL